MTTYTAVIMAVESSSSYGNVAVVSDDTDLQILAGPFALPAVPDHLPDPPAMAESDAGRVLARNGWRVTGNWGVTGEVLYASAERI
jgi:hypothetical protein